MALAEERQRVQNGEIDESTGKVEWPIDANKKHPLENQWTFWFDNRNSAKSKSGTPWGSTLRPVYTFSTVEEFWCIYSNVFQPSKLPSGSDFHCFKHGIEPKWEDPKCANGGKWTANNNRGGKAGFDSLWLETLLAMIGEQFEEGDEICGAVASARTRQDKVALWTKTATNEATQVSIGRQWKEILDYSEKLVYTFHEDARREDMRRDKTSNRYTV